MRFVLILVLAGALAGTAVAASRPHVRLLGSAPAAVSGQGFHARERVTVTVSSASTRLTPAPS